MSALLLDTHVFLWWRMNDPRLGSSARAAVASAPLVFVSAASAWEAAMKAALGKLSIPEPFARGVDEAQLEGCTLVSHDRVLAPYGVPMLWV